MPHNGHRRRTQHLHMRYSGGLHRHPRALFGNGKPRPFFLPSGFVPLPLSGSPLIQAFLVEPLCRNGLFAGLRHALALHFHLLLRGGNLLGLAGLALKGGYRLLAQSALALGNFLQELRIGGFEGPMLGRERVNFRLNPARSFPAFQTDPAGFGERRLCPAIQLVQIRAAANHSRGDHCVDEGDSVAHATFRPVWLTNAPTRPRMTGQEIQSHAKSAADPPQPQPPD